MVDFSDLASRLVRVRQLARGMATSSTPPLPSWPGKFLGRISNRFSAQWREACDNLAHVGEVLGDGQREISLRMAQMEALLVDATRQVEHQQAEIAMLQAALARLTERVGGLALAQKTQALPSGAEGREPAVDALGGGDFDQFYADFEAAFRGDAELVTQRQSDYLPLLMAVLPPGKPVFDLGCGRGEWMRLLHAHGLPSVGWDINGRFIEDNREAGLDVRHGDGLKEVARIAMEAPGSLGAITAFHVIEHIPFAALLTLMDHAYLALAEGGVIIFETPNPENLSVGANTFFVDPTHQRPLHPATLVFTAERAGFVQAQAWRLCTARGCDPLIPIAGYEALNPLLDRINQHLSVGPDVALVARKQVPLPQGVQP